MPEGVGGIADGAGCPDATAIRGDGGGVARGARQCDGAIGIGATGDGEGADFSAIDDVVACDDRD